MRRRAGVEFVEIDCTSRHPDPVMREGLSPFYLGPVDCYDGLVAQRFERAWQCAKVYPWQLGTDGNPGAEYFAWRDEMWGWDGFSGTAEIRFPVGKKNAGKCCYAWWKVGDEYKRLGYVEARKQIYLPVYAKAVVKTEAYHRLVELRDAGKNLMLLDFDGYNPHHPKYGFTYNDVVHCPILKMGHGFVLAMLLDGVIKVEDGEVKYADGLMTPPDREWSADLRCLPEEVKLQRNATAAGVTVEEWLTLDTAARKWLRAAAKKEIVYSRGFTKAGWKRLPLAEKLKFMKA